MDAAEYPFAYYAISYPLQLEQAAHRKATYGPALAVGTVCGVMRARSTSGDVEEAYQVSGGESQDVCLSKIGVPPRSFLFIHFPCHCGSLL